MKHRIIDLDNCLCDDSHRLEAINWQKTKNARYLEYHLLCGFDKPANLDIAIHPSIIILTGRPCLVRGITERWLDMNHVGFRHMLMRANEDERHGPAVKREMIRNLHDYYDISPSDIECAYDDRADILEVYQEFGIPVRQRVAHQQCAYVNPLRPGAEPGFTPNRSIA